MTNKKRVKRKNEKHSGYSRGMLLYKNKDYTNALHYLLDDYKINKDDRTGLAIARCYIELARNEHELTEKSKRYNQAKKVLISIIDKSPDFVEAHFSLGMMYFEREQLEESKLEFNICLKHQPANNFLHFQLGKIALKEGKIDKAKKYFKNSIRHKYKNGIAHLELGKIYLEEYKYEQAKKEFDACIEINSKDSYAHYQLGILYRLQGMYDQAVGEFNTCLELEPNNQFIHLQLGIIYRDQNIFKLSNREFKTALEGGLDNAQTHYHLGLLFKKQNKIKEAEREFYTCLEFNPVNADVHYQLGILFREQMSYKLSYYEFNTCLEINPDDSNTHLQLGILYLEQKNYKKAEIEFKTSLNADNSNPSAELLLKSVQETLSNNANLAEKYLKIAYEIGIENIYEKGYNTIDRLIHIKKHFRDDKSKPKHTVFKENSITIFQHILKNMSDGTYNLYRMNSTDIYLIKMPECGYSGGKTGDKHLLDYIQIIVHKKTDRIITIYPSNGAEEIKSTSFVQIIKSENLKAITGQKTINPEIIENIENRIRTFIKLEKAKSKRSQAYE